MKAYTFILLFFSIALYPQNKSEAFYKESLKAEAKKDYDNAMNYINKAIAIDSSKRDYKLQKVKLLYFKSDCNEGLKILEKIVTEENRFDDITISYYSELADCVGEIDKGNEALQYYINETNSPEIIATLAQRYFNQGRYEEAINYYRKVVAIDPNDIDAIIDLSKMLFSYKSPQDAITELENGLKTNKKNVRLLTYLASCYHNIKEYDKAIDILDMIIPLEYNADNLASRAMLNELKKNNSKAYEDYKSIIKLAKCDVTYNLKLLEYEFTNRMYENVIKNSKTFLSCNSDYEALVLDGLYTSLFFEGDYNQGKIYLKKKLDQNPKNFNPFYFKILTSFTDKDYSNILKNIDLASKTQDIDDEGKNNIKFLKLCYYLVIEDYNNLHTYLGSNDLKSFKNNANFIIIQKPTEKTFVETKFNKETGIINTYVTIPKEMMKVLQDKYGLRIN